MSTTISTPLDTRSANGSIVRRFASPSGCGVTMRLRRRRGSNPCLRWTDRSPGHSPSRRTITTPMLSCIWSSLHARWAPRSAGTASAQIGRSHADPERRFAVLIDADPTVEKWLKPGRAQFQIEYRSGDNYEPDFVVETDTRVVICEVKSKDELSDPVVQAKAKAATKWCQAATRHAAECGAKPWSYVLLGDVQIMGSATLTGLISKFAHG